MFLNSHPTVRAELVEALGPFDKLRSNGTVIRDTG
jgi:hypothetical protein